MEDKDIIVKYTKILGHFEIKEEGGGVGVS